MTVRHAIIKNGKLWTGRPIIVVNKYGGEDFKAFSNVKFFQQDNSFWFARRFGMEFVETKYVLCLDVDTILPEGYVEKALEILESKPEVAVVALNYALPSKQDHLAFGTSVWRTALLKHLYDWRLCEGAFHHRCECQYMWEKVEKIGLKVETFAMFAIHLKEENQPPNK